MMQVSAPEELLDVGAGHRDLAGAIGCWHAQLVPLRQPCIEQRNDLPRRLSREDQVNQSSKANHNARGLRSLHEPASHPRHHCS